MSNLSKNMMIMHLSMLSPQGGRPGYWWGLDFLKKILSECPNMGQQNTGEYWNIPHHGDQIPTV
jgi:hypothetical protein